MRDSATQAAGDLTVVKAVYEKQARKHRCHRSAHDQDRQYCEQQASLVTRRALSQPVHVISGCFGAIAIILGRSPFEFHF